MMLLWSAWTLVSFAEVVACFWMQRYGVHFVNEASVVGAGAGSIAWCAVLIGLGGAHGFCGFGCVEVCVASMGACGCVW